jgi:hypothetical protein
MKTPAPTEVKTSAPSKRKFSSASTATGAQRLRLLKALRAGPKTTLDLRRLGVIQVAARIKELRDWFGCVIVTERVYLIDAEGYPHHGCGRYVLTEDESGESHDS